MIFVDTSAFIAIQHAPDSHHEKAILFKNHSIQEGAKFFTSDYILDETYTWLRVHVNHHAAVSFGEDLRTSQFFQIQHVAMEIIEDAWKIFKKFSEQRFSFTDCTSFVIMKRLRIDTAFSFDSDFKAFGHFLMKP